MAGATPQSVDEYIASQPESARKALGQVRGAIRKALPNAEEWISYKMPAYRVNGKWIVYFAGWKRHYSLYPVGRRAVDKFRDQLAAYSVEKATARFPLSEPVPVRLIERVAKFLAKEAAAKAEET